ncbi:Aste57867_23421 [Aphanomyces stellatus]|uniref:Aste57867_23421 protein n=1 Tax=Aphanomyces stellatus TaxID=120398 RepID=A0A485LMS7_9STRA|nr:hypothetical protein As57867_023350 [Aphanomyces stellatus]VFU00067.1 Aste57867_23421 [Aphanomyces stellatus]
MIAAAKTTSTHRIGVRAAPKVILLLMSLPSADSSTPYSSSLHYDPVSDAAGFRFSGTFLMLCLFLFGFLCTQPKKARATTAVVTATSSKSRQFVMRPSRRTQPRATSVPDTISTLPTDLSNEIWSYLDAPSLAVCMCVCTAWGDLTGEGNPELWQWMFLRDMREDGRRFRAPCDLGWRAYYFTHRLTRPFERMQLLLAEGRAVLVIGGRVYDVEPFIYIHPGGHRVITDVIGTDATDTWLQFEHSDGAKASMAELEVRDTLVPAPMRGTIGSVVAARQSTWKRTARRVHTLFRRFLIPAADDDDHRDDA